MKFLFRDKIFRLALRIIHDYEEAQDITQDITERIWKKRKNIGSYKSVEALAMKMTKDLCLDKLKHKGIKEEKHKDLQQTLNYNYQKYEIKDLAERTIELINSLPEKQKLIIHLRDVEGYEFAEIVKILDMDINAVRMNLSRARKTIKEQIENLSNYGL